MQDLVNEVLTANCALPAHRLAPLTWGNASGIDRDEGLVFQAQKGGTPVHPGKFQWPLSGPRALRLLPLPS